jgi:hypothetical protein
LEVKYLKIVSKKTPNADDIKGFFNNILYVKLAPPMLDKIPGILIK